MRNRKIGLLLCLYLSFLAGCQANKETTTETAEESIVIGFPSRERKAAGVNAIRNRSALN